MIPRSSAIATAWVRSTAPSFPSKLRTWTLTVSSVRPIAAAICRLRNPAATIISTSSSRAVSSTRGEPSCSRAATSFGSGTPGVLFFVHGGVWIVGNFENHQRLLRDLVVGSGQVGVFVEYSPLPAAKYPTQLEESYAALEWVASHASEFGADGTRIAIAGNSVGGDLTAALTLMAKDRQGPRIAYQVLLIPATNARVDTDSYREFATGRFLPRAFMQYGWELYAPDEQTRSNPYVSPLRASDKQLQGLPPALVITAENDPLRDEGEAYARRLKDAGVAVTATRYNGMIHDFVLLNAIHELPAVQSALKQASDAIRDALQS